MSNPLLEVFRQLPAELSKFVCIAGGAASDYSKAQDVDVYVMRYKGLADGDERRAAVLGLFDPVAVVPEKSEFDCCVAEYAGSKVVKELEIDGKPVQIIDTELATPAEVLAKFDLSTHTIAYTPDGVWYGNTDPARLTESPKLGYVHDAALTWSRYRKLCKRYNLPVNFETIVLLLHMKDKS